MSGRGSEKLHTVHSVAQGGGARGRGGHRETEGRQLRKICKQKFSKIVFRCSCAVALQFNAN